MELGDAAAWTSAAVAVGAACTSIWQARIAKRGADLSSRQASAAEQQAVDAERAANIALEQLALARSQLDQDKRDSQLQRNLTSYKAVVRLASEARRFALAVRDFAEIIEQQRAWNEDAKRISSDMRSGSTKVEDAWFDYVPFAGYSPFRPEANRLRGAVRVKLDFGKVQTDDGRAELVEHMRERADAIKAMSNRIDARSRLWISTILEEPAEPSPEPPVSSDERLDPQK